MRKTRLLALGLVIGCLSACGQADAAQSVKLHVRFSPNRPNASTTIHFGFHVVATDGRVPSPVTAVALALPTGMGLGLMTLGERLCM